MTTSNLLQTQIAKYAADNGRKAAIPVSSAMLIRDLNFNN